MTPHRKLKPKIGEHPWLANDHYAECRTLTGHRWRKHGPYSLDGRELGVTHRCSDCGAERTTWFDVWSGATRARWYSYSPGYCEATTKGKPTKRTELRSLYIRTLIKTHRVTRAKRPRRG